MNIAPITLNTRPSAIDFIRAHWFSTLMAVHGELIDLAKLDGFTACEQTDIVGLITYRITGKICEIMSLDSIHEHVGTGSALLNAAIAAAEKVSCEKITLITTNDNLNAMGFYQKRGFDMAHFYRDAVEAARNLKPEIPLIGDNGIPLRHEIEFERIL